MKDVAKEAGVALGTVSKVINGLPVGESYRVRVEKAAAKLGYQVNNYARGLRTSKTRLVAVLLPGTLHPFFGALAEHLYKELSRRGYRMLLSLSGYNVSAEQACIQMVRRNKVDGIIGLTYSPEIDIPSSIPFVSIDRYFGPDIPCVTSDNFSGGQLAAQKLEELGCKRLLFFRKGSAVHGEADKRGPGFESYCQFHGLNYTAFRVNDEEGFSPFEDFLREHLGDDGLEFDGIFCNTDTLAAHVMVMLRKMGVSVPEQVQIIGFDGTRMIGFHRYYCSTIVQPVDKLAEAAVSILLNEQPSTPPALVCLPVTYAPGGSTKDGGSSWPVST